MSRPLAIVLVVALACAIAAGPRGWSKLFWQAGQPGLALALLDDPAARGAALYRLGRYEEADAAFAEVGRSATYNRALTLAATGDYALSAAYFRAVLFVNRYDAEARANLALVEPLAGYTVGEATGHGRIRAMLAEQGVETPAFDPANPEATLMLAGRAPLNAKRPVDGQRSVVAGDDWLDTLADEPAAYLRARLAAEMRRRHIVGVEEEREEDRW